MKHMAKKFNFIFWHRGREGDLDPGCTGIDEDKSAMELLRSGQPSTELWRQRGSSRTLNPCALWVSTDFVGRPRWHSTDVLG